MENIKDIVDWVIWMLVAVVGWFLKATISRIEKLQEKHEDRISKVETDVAVIGKSVDQNFATLSSSIGNIQTQLLEVKTLLIDELKKYKQ